MLSTTESKREPPSPTALPEGGRGRVLAVALLVAVLLALWVGVAAPLTDWYRDRADRIAQRQTLATRMAQIAAELPELRRQAASTEAAAPVSLLTGNTDALAGAALQGRLQQISTEIGATLASAEVLPGEQLGAYRRVGVRLLITASWPVLINLVGTVTGGSPRLLVNDLQIQSARFGTDNVEPVLNTSMVVFGFRSGRAS